jgi:curli biogenesis system outer membrane secretion channel CsgG
MLRKTIKTIVLLILPVALFGCMSLSGAAPVRVGISSENAADIKKIAVMPFTISYTVKPSPDFIPPKDEGYTVSDIYTVEFLLNGYQCVERGQIEKVLEEQNIQHSGITSSNADLVELGSVLNVQGIVIGSAIFDGNWNWTIKLIDVATADIVWVANGLNVTAKQVVSAVAKKLK